MSDKSESLPEYTKEIEGMKGELLSVEALASQTQDTLEWIMRWGTELLDDNAKMVVKLERLEGILEAAIDLYKERYNAVNFEPIRWHIESIVSCGYADGLDAAIVDIQGIFSGVQGTELSEADIALFRGFQSKLIAQESPEIQSYMLWFFELVNDYVKPKNRENIQRSLHKNPIKEILFGEDNISYTQWIAGIFEGFEKDQDGMISLSKSVQNAEPPMVTTKEFIRSLFRTNPGIIEEADLDFLSWYYEKYEDDTTAKVDAPDVAKRNAIANKYILKYGECGTASAEERLAARNLRDAILRKEL